MATKKRPVKKAEPQSRFLIISNEPLDGDLLTDNFDDVEKFETLDAAIDALEEMFEVNPTFDPANFVVYQVQAEFRVNARKKVTLEKV